MGTIAIRTISHASQLEVPLVAVIRMDIQTVVVSNGSPSSLVVLKPHRRRKDSSIQLPISIGAVESMAISMGIEDVPHKRPVTHELMRDAITALGASVSDIVINDVRDTTFYAQVRLRTAQGDLVCVDSRPSDAIALAVRTHAPIYVDERVLETASLPDFGGVRAEEEREEMERFHDFVENLSPEDFSAGDA